MSTQTILPIDRNSVIEHSRVNNEPEWMTNLRLQALELAGQLEYPKLEKTRIDRWNLESLHSHAQAGKSQVIQEIPEAAKSLMDEQTGPLVFLNSSGEVFSRLPEELASQGVIFTDLNTAIQKHTDLVQPYFMKAVTIEEHKFAALHAASWSGGVFLYVPKNVTAEIPFQSFFLADSVNAAYSSHILIVAEDNSSVIFTDSLVSREQEGEQVSNVVVEVFVKQGAKVHFSSVHQMGERTVDIAYRRAVVEKDGSIEWVVGEMNNGNGISDTTSLLKGEGSFSDAKVICVGVKAQSLNLTTRAVHIGKRTTSEMSTRAVMRDEATAIINGVTKIEKGATGANGEQAEQILMLSPQARGDANPILLIDEDEVMAGHAASVGQVNPEHIHYLMTRGISRQDAERLIIYGFLAPIVSQIPLEKLEQRLRQVVERKLR